MGRSQQRPVRPLPLGFIPHQSFICLRTDDHTFIHSYQRASKAHDASVSYQEGHTQYYTFSCFANCKHLTDRDSLNSPRQFQDTLQLSISVPSSACTSCPSCLCVVGGIASGTLSQTRLATRLALHPESTRKVIPCLSQLPGNKELEL